MPLPTDRHQIESDLAGLAAGPSSEIPAPFLAAVRARRRVVYAQRASVVVLGAIVVVTGFWFIPSSPTPPSAPIVAQEEAVIEASPDRATSPGAATLASLRRLYTQPDGAIDLLATLPSTPLSPPSPPAEPPLRLRDARLLLAEGV